MANAKLYLRPIGLLYGAAADAAVAEGVALPLAGGPIAFAAAELIEGEPGSAKRQIFTARALADTRDAASRRACSSASPRSGRPSPGSRSTARC